MQLANLAKSSQQLGRLLQKNSPTIFTGLAVTGLVTTVFMAIKATPKANKLMLEKEMDTDEELTPSDYISVLWRPYLPTVLMGSATIACIITSNSIHLRRNAALMGLYSLTESTLREYQSKVVETIGRSKEDHIQADLAQDQLDHHPVEQRTVVLTGKGDHLFFDGISGRYFRSDIEKMRKIQNDLNHQLLTNMYVTLNDLYFEMGLEGIMLGSDLGWEVNHMLEFRFDSKITPEGEPCIVLNHIIRPSVLA